MPLQLKFSKHIDISSIKSTYRDQQQELGVKPMAVAQFVKESQIVRRVASNPRCRFRWTDHALKEIAKDGRTTNDVEYSLANCRVTLEEWKKDRLWRTEGPDIDGNLIQAVIAVYEEEIEIKVVTAF